MSSSFFDTRTDVIQKKFYQKCTDLNFIKGEGPQLISEHLRGSSRFHLLKIPGKHLEDSCFTDLLHNKYYRWDFYTMHRVSKCSTIVNNATVFMPCFKFNYAFSFLQKLFVDHSSKTRQDFKKFMNDMQSELIEDEMEIDRAIDLLLNFFSKVVKIYGSVRKAKPVVVKVKDINRLIFNDQQSKLNWMKIFNNFYLKTSHIESDEEEILIENSEVFIGSIKLLYQLDDADFSSAILVAFIFSFQYLIQLYPLRSIDVYKRGTIKAYQKHEQCIEQLDQVFAPALMNLFAKKYIAQGQQEYAESFIREALDDMIYKIKSNDKLEDSIKREIIKKINNIQVVAGFPAETTSEEKINELYDELDLTGDEGTIRIGLDLINYNMTLENEPRDNWKFATNQLSLLKNLKFLHEKNILFIPPEYITYPYFSQKRSRFFNTATLFTEVVLVVNEGLEEFVKKTFDKNLNLGYNSIQLGYENYVKWIDEKGNAEKDAIPGINLTLPQLYWLTTANIYFMKYHRNVPFYQLDALELQFTHYHLWFKARTSFRDAFNCGEMTQSELNEFETFRMIMQREIEQFEDFSVCFWKKKDRKDSKKEDRAFIKEWKFFHILKERSSKSV